MSSRYKTWSTQRRYKAALAKILDDGWTISEAARTFDINRSHLSTRVKEARAERKAKEEAAAEEMERNRIPLIQETRQVGTFEEFEQNYFSGLICPDCQTHHATPEFHHEIIRAVESDARRVLINIPPYHSKSTLVTVKHTVYDIARNPNSRTIIVSRAATFAKQFNMAIQEWLRNPELYYNTPRNLIEDWGPFAPTEKSDRSGGWSEYETRVRNRVLSQGVQNDPTVYAMGYGGQIYGRRADRIKFDDYATLENQKNPDRVLGMLEWTDKEALSRIGKRGQAVWCGTRVSAGDVYSVLDDRPGYQVIRYPALIDDEHEQVLWPEHFPYSQVLVHRSEMSPADFQLVYQNVDIPGLHASFTEEMMSDAKDTGRQRGHWQNGWRLIAGLDPAGGNKNSGYTSLVLLGVDLDSGVRFVIDKVSEKAMKAPRLKELMFEWTDRYPIYEWRVEANGVQSQLVQYNEEVIQHLAKRGVRVVPHYTHGNKWDAEFGVESIASQFYANLVSIPWAGATTAQHFQSLVEQFISFPMGTVSDEVMAYWFAELGIRDLLRRAHLPMFNERERKRWPKRIRRRAKIVDFQNREVRPVKLEDQYVGHLSIGQAGYRRMTVGSPTAHGRVEEGEPPTEDQPMNIDPRIWQP